MPPDERQKDQRSHRPPGHEPGGRIVSGHKRGEERNEVIGETEEIEKDHCQEEIKHRGKPERTDPYKRRRNGGQPGTLQEPPGNKRQGQKQEEDQAGDAQRRAGRYRLPPPEEYVEIRKAVNEKEYGEEDNHVHFFHRGPVRRRPGR